MVYYFERGAYLHVLEVYHTIVVNHTKLFIEAIDAVGRKKPKFPFTSVTQSALLFVSIYLKASNPNMTEYTRMKWTEILDQFNNDCDNISFLGRKMTRRYRAPSQVIFKNYVYITLSSILATTRTRYQTGTIFQPQTKARVYEKDHKLIFISSNLYFCIKRMK